MAACPTYATDPRYSGPMPLTQAHRYNTDTRDDGFETRRTVLAGNAGPWRCHFAGECSRVCPKGVDPARAIQLMKRELVLDYLRLRRQKCPAGIVARPAGIARREGIPDAPKPTIEARRSGPSESVRRLPAAVQVPSNSRQPSPAGTDATDCRSGLHPAMLQAARPAATSARTPRPAGSAGPRRRAKGIDATGHPARCSAASRLPKNSSVDFVFACCLPVRTIPQAAR
jgi:ferredoxin